MPKDPDEDKLINELFKEYRQMMLRIALRILQNRADAEDAVQDAFLRMLNSLDKISGIPREQQAFYLVSVIENTSLNILKKKNRRPTEDIEEFYEISSEYSVEESTGEKLLLDDVRSALMELSERDYGIMYLLYFEQLSPAEIAEKLDIPQKNIYKYIDRAKKRLAKILKERGVDQ